MSDITECPKGTHRFDFDEVIYGGKLASPKGPRCLCRKAYLEMGIFELKDLEAGDTIKILCVEDGCGK